MKYKLFLIILLLCLLVLSACSLVETETSVPVYVKPANSGYSSSTDYPQDVVLNQNNNERLTEEQEILLELEDILINFDKTHTYSAEDDFMCVDMSTELWNVIKTAGYGAMICIGNVDEDISYEMNLLNWINLMNHAWVKVEVQPFTWIAAESTGGYLVFGEGSGGDYDVESELYYEGICFDNPAEYKDFAKAEENAYEYCDEYDYLVNYWNENIAGESESKDNIELNGRMDLLEEQCNKATNKLRFYTE